MPSKEKAQKEKKLFDKTYPIFLVERFCFWVIDKGENSGTIIMKTFKKL